MQKQALKGLFFNISTCFSPLLAVFLTGENSLMFFRLPSHLYHLVCRAHKTSPHAAATCLYNKVYPFCPIALSLQPTIAFLFIHKRSISFQSLQNWKELHNFVMMFKGK
jgi:hypothetical protein